MRYVNFFLQVPKKKNYRHEALWRNLRNCAINILFLRSRVIRVTPANQPSGSFQKLKEHNDKSMEGKLILTIFVHADSDFWTHPSHVVASVDICVSTEEYPALAKLLKENDIVLTS